MVTASGYLTLAAGVSPEYWNDRLYQVKYITNGLTIVWHDIFADIAAKILGKSLLTSPRAPLLPKQAGVYRLNNRSYQNNDVVLVNFLFLGLRYSHIPRLHGSLPCIILKFIVDPTQYFTRVIL
jgi:hypothetical protein